MELNEFRTAWQSLDQRITDLEAESRGRRTRSAVTRLTAMPIFELVVGCLAVLWAGGVFADNFHRAMLHPASAIPIVTVWVLGIATIALSVLQIFYVSRVDISGPILSAQRDISRIRRLRVRSSQFFILLGLPLWVVFPLALGQAIIDWNFIYAVNGAWIGGNAVFGIVLAIALLGLCRKYRDRPLAQRISDILAGSELVRTERLLTDIAEFERS
ncbi:MAG: hypothetical protein BGO01_07680 [Armatimonadetes bacterium 55-13]|nr:MAG: hypothetical protein BGO01_07680 [Armatimonadetes bacterium 55-13]